VMRCSLIFFLDGDATRLFFPMVFLACVLF
jgi:hypothetical protein